MNGKARILVVDDDAIIQGLYADNLGKEFHVISADSGEAALKMVAHERPDVVLLDVEMPPGIGGYETCRLLKEMSMTENIPIIFISSRASIDDRIKGYEAGGQDYLIKPFDPVELKAKISHLLTAKDELANLKEKANSSNRATIIALTDLADTGISLRFIRSAMNCPSLQTLARLTINSMGSFGIDCHFQIRTPTQTLTLTPQGLASPLEESVIKLSQNSDRIFSFGNRLILNYNSVSLLIPNMPISDNLLCGRIRDHGAIIAESADLAAENINLQIDARNRADDLVRLADGIAETVKTLRGGFSEMNLATRLELEGMVSNLESMYIHFGLTDGQEAKVSANVRDSVNRALNFLELGGDLDQSFVGIVKELKKAGEYKVIEHGEPMVKDVELW